MKSRGGFHHRCAVLFAAIVDGMWPQARRAEDGWTDDAQCQMCLAARGTAWHRIYGCPVLDNFRLSGDPSMIFQWARRQPEWPLWKRCLLRDPTWDFPAPVIEDSITWVQRPTYGLLEGRTFGDGSSLRGTHGRLRRCGWGLATLDVCGRAAALAYGPLPGRQQDVLLAESHSLLMYLRMGIATFRFWTDC